MFIVRYLVAGLVGWWLVRWRGGQAPSGVASVPSASLRCIEFRPPTGQRTGTRSRCGSVQLGCTGESTECNNFMRMMLIFLLSNLILATTCEDMDGDGRKPQGLRGPQTRCDVKPYRCPRRRHRARLGIRTDSKVAAV